MKRTSRSDLFLGFGIPVAALVFLGLLIFAFSRILLAVPETLAPWIALLFATNILVGCALAAMIPGTRGFSFLISILIATIVIGGVAGFVIGPRPVHSLVEEGDHPAADAPEHEEPGGGEPGKEEDEAPPPKNGATVAIAAQALEFDAVEISLPAGEPAIVSLDNQDDGIPHNLSIYTEQGGESLFEGEVVTGPTQIDYEVPPQEPGEYFFQCDIHPTTMTGTVTVG